MIERNRLKRLIAKAVAAIGVVALIGLLAATGRIASWQTQSPPPPASGLREVGELPSGADQLVTWLPDSWTGHRAMEPATRVQIEAAYVRAWAAIGRYQATGDTGPVATAFAGPARTAVLAMPRGTTASWSVAHRLQLTFYALDGEAVAVTDTDANIVRSSVVGGLPTITDVHETYQAVLVLQDGYWRIQQLRRTGAGAPVVVGPETRGPGAAVLTGVPGTAPRALPAMRGVGYRLRVDEPIDEASIGADLDTVRRLGLDTIRVPLPYDALGDTPDQKALRPVRRLLDLAAARRIRVVPVLFAGAARLTPDVWSATDMHLRAVVGPLRDHPALAMWDLADTPDRRGAGTAGLVEVYAWLVHTVRQLREVDPVRPVTVSWSGAAAGSATVNALFDSVSLAWDGPREELPATLAELDRYAAGRPVLLSRYGIGTYNGVFPGGHTEAEQAYDLAQTRLIAERSGLRGVIFAELRDATSPSADARLPWRVGGADGLLHADGTPKKAAALVGSRTGLGRVPTPTPVEAVHKPFWWLMAALGAATLLLATVLGRVRRWGRRAAPKHRR
jgi:hypothetical protein